jgi:hypothetical protein
VAQQHAVKLWQGLAGRQHRPHLAGLKEGLGFTALAQNVVAYLGFRTGLVHASCDRMQGQGRPCMLIRKFTSKGEYQCMHSVQ